MRFKKYYEGVFEPASNEEAYNRQIMYYDKILEPLLRLLPKTVKELVYSEIERTGNDTDHIDFIIEVIKARHDINNYSDFNHYARNFQIQPEDARRVFEALSQNFTWWKGQG